jgi:PAS domain S-box-containing protein
MSIYLVSLLVQGVGGLFLMLVCYTLFLHRRRLYFLYWTLSWLCLTLWLLLGSLKMEWQDIGLGSPGARLWVQDAAVVGGWWHAALWVLGMFDFRATHRFRADESEGDQDPTTDGLTFPRSHALVLLGVAAWAVLVSRLVSLPGRDLLLSVALLLVYGSSAVIFIRVHRRFRDLGVLSLAVVLAVSAIEQLHYAVLWTTAWQTGLRPEYLSYLRFADFLLETLTAVAMIVVFLHEEQHTLRAALARLAESEDHFRLVFEHSGVGMALFAPDGRFLRVNPALTRFLGYDSGELQGRSLRDLAHPDEVRSRTPPDGPVYAQTERERCFLHKDGSPVWARVLRVALRDTAGNLRYSVGVLVDITKRRQAEKALAASELRYRLRFQGAFDGVYSCTETGDFLDANPAFFRMLGYTSEEVQGLRLADVAVHLSQLRRHLATVLAHGGDRLETRLRHKDGHVVDVEISSAGMELERRRVVHGIVRDISERKEAEEVLRQAEETLREERDFSSQVLETADALIVVLDWAGRIVRFNGKCTAVSGYREEEVRGWVFWDFLIPGRFIERVRKMFDQLVTDQVPTLCENPWLTRSGEERLISWRNTTVGDASGELRYVIGTGIDITDQRRLEEQLRHAQKMETLGTLVGGIAHDFNNQLTIILGNIGMVLAALPAGESGVRDHGSGVKSQASGVSGKTTGPSSLTPDPWPLTPGLTAGPRSPLADAERAAQRCADMTRQLLTFSSRRVGRTLPVSPNHLLIETARLLRRVLPATIHIDIQAAAGVWMVHSDPTQLHQVLMNLAVNARDAMPRGGTLTLAAANQMVDAADCARNVEARGGQFVVLSVQDTGVGMTPEVQARIFDPFFTTKEVGQGTGLGLAVVFGIVKAHGGWITVTSAPGEGSTFSVYLPAVEAPVVSTESELSPPPVFGGHECILAVDDEDLVRNLVWSVLKRWGFRVLTAADGEEALAIYREQGADIDLVLLDFTMPGLTGLDVLQQLREINPAVRVILSSGHTQPVDNERLLAAGARAFVAKPYHPDELVRRIRQVLDEPAADLPVPAGNGSDVSAAGIARE